MSWRQKLPEARRSVRWAVDQYGEDRLAMTSAFGLNGMGLIHIVARMDLDIPILFVDTGYLFPETLETKRRVVEQYGLRVYTLHPIGRKLPLPRSDECCRLRKVAPMRKALALLRPAVLLSARGRFQAVTRRTLAQVELDRDPVRVNPLVDWEQAEVEAFIQDNGVPYNPLYDQGYVSIGCWPCTRPVVAGEDIRAGRWDGLGRVECGLWSDK